MLLGLSLTGEADPSQQASPSTAPVEATSDKQFEAMAQAVVADRLSGLSVVVVAAPGASEELMTTVSTALSDAGATQSATLELASAWWDPAQVAFRAELAAQLSTDDAGDWAAAFEQAVVSSVYPSAYVQAQDQTVVGEATSTASLDDAAARADILKRAGILGFDAPVDGAVDAVVIVASDITQGGVEALLRASLAWEGAVTSSVIVVDQAGAKTASQQALDLSSGLLEVTQGQRSSLVLATDASLTGAQVVAALAAQLGGQAGNYGAIDGLELIAIP